MVKHGKTYYVPFDMVLQHQDIHKSASVYLAVLVQSNANGRAVISLRDIIYKMCFTPSRGHAGVNKKIAETINKLRELGYFEEAPDYLAMNRIESAKKFGFKVADMPRGLKTHCGVPADVLERLLYIKRIPMLLNDDKRAFTLKFCAEAAIRCYFAIRRVLLDWECGAAYVPRSYMAEMACISEATVTNTTAFLQTAGFIRKRECFTTDQTGALRKIMYYTLNDGTDEEIDKRLRSAASVYIAACQRINGCKGKTIGGEPVKVSDWGKYKDWV